MLKLTESSLDPYTRFTVGLAVGSAIVFTHGDENPGALFLGIGILIGSALQLIDVAKGGRFINQNLRSGGYKTKQWVDQQADLRWKELYDRSL